MEKLNLNLYDIMNSLGKTFSNKTIALILEQIVSSLEILHRSGYIHRDLKPENMMTTLHNHQIKLIDFGIADTISAKK